MLSVAGLGVMGQAGQAIGHLFPPRSPEHRARTRGPSRRTAGQHVTPAGRLLFQITGASPSTNGA
jgi:hypothetical protein